MTWITTRMKWILLVSGVLTCTMIYAAIAPQAALQSMFGETAEGVVAEIIVRNWSILVTLVGVMMIYGAFNPWSRPLVVTVAGLSKACFIALVLSHGTRFLDHQVSIAAAVDVVVVLLFIGYLLGRRAGGEWK